MSPELEQRISHIEGFTASHLEALKEMLQADQAKMFGLDFLAIAALKRSMSLCAAFSLLVRNNNYLTSAALVRLQLDTCLRFFASFIVEEPHEFALQMLKGVSVRDMVDRAGKRMTDRYLVDLLGKEYDWMPRVYAETSGFVHLSEKHMLSVWGPGTSDSFPAIVGPADEHIADHFWIEMADGFIACTDALFLYVSGWIFTKQNPELVADERTRRGL